MGSEPDRRGDPREACDVEVVITAGSRRVVARAVDISATGMGVRTLEPFEPGALVRASFCLPDEEGRERRVEAAGILVRVERGDEERVVGLRFSVLDSHAVGRMQAVVEACRRGALQPGPDGTPGPSGDGPAGAAGGDGPVEASESMPLARLNLRPAPRVFRPKVRVPTPRPPRSERTTKKYPVTPWA